MLKWPRAGHRRRGHSWEVEECGAERLQIESGVSFVVAFSHDVD